MVVVLLLLLAALIYRDGSGEIEKNKKKNRHTFKN
jgi:hypothetical protein